MFIFLSKVIFVFHFVEFVFTLAQNALHISWKVGIHGYNKCLQVMCFHHLRSKFLIPFFKFVKQKSECCIVPKSPYGVFNFSL
jgi:hypothetical protein